jgi:hypothetical protein
METRPELFCRNGSGPDPDVVLKLPIEPFDVPRELEAATRK